MKKTNLHEYIVEADTPIKTAVENAIHMARATNTITIVNIKGTRFCVYPNTTVQEAIDTFFEVKNKMFETQKLLRQKAK